MLENNSHPEAKKSPIMDGLPDIAKEAQANDKRYLKAALLVLVGLIVLFFIGQANLTKSTPKADNLVTEESYTLQGATPTQSIPQPIKPTPITPQLTEQQQQMLLALEKERQARLQAPVMLVGKAQTVSDTPANRQPLNSTNQNTQFLAHVSAQDSDTLTATAMGNRSLILAEGSLIHGVLESAIHSDLPGMIRAIVAEPVYSEDASRVLIEPGSRLIGQYLASMQQGQMRAFVVWTVLIQPSGSRIKLASPGTNNLGIAGAEANKIDYHFWERFGTSSLLSILGAGAANIGVNSNDVYNASQAYRQAVAGSFAEAARDTYRQSGAIPPTLHINQGQPIIVFVAHTLDFSKVIKTSQQKMNVF